MNSAGIFSPSLNLLQNSTLMESEQILASKKGDTVSADPLLVKTFDDRNTKGS